MEGIGLIGMTSSIYSPSKQVYAGINPNVYGQTNFVASGYGVALVRDSLDTSLKVSEPRTLAIFLFSLIGLTTRHFKLISITFT